MPRSLKQTFFRGALIVNLALVATWGVNLGRNVVLARILDPALLGRMGLILFWIGLLRTVFSLQTRHYVIREPQATNTSFCLELLWISFGLVMARVALPPILGLYGRPDLVPYIHICAVGLATNLFFFLQAVLERDFKFGRAQLPVFLARLLGAITAVSMALAGYGLWALVTAYLVAEIGTLAGVWVTSAFGFRFRIEKAWIRPSLIFSLPMALEEAIAFLAWNVDYFIVGLLVGEKQIGFYWLAFAISQYLIAVPTGLQSITYPVFVNIQADGKLKQAVERLTEHTALIMGLAAAVMTVAGEPLVKVAFGEKWLPSAATLKILTASVAIRCVFSHWVSYYKRKGSTLLIPMSSVVNILCIVAVGPVATARWGIRGMAWVVFFSCCVGFCVPAVMMWRLSRINYARILYRPLLIFSLATSLSLVLARSLPPSTPWQLAPVPVLLLAYAGLTFVLARPALHEWQSMLGELRQGSRLRGASDAGVSRTSASSTSTPGRPSRYAPPEND